MAPLHIQPTASANLTPDQDSARWQAVIRWMQDVERRFRGVLSSDSVTAYGGSQTAVQTLNVGRINITPDLNKTLFSIGGLQGANGGFFPLIQVPAASIELLVQPQLGIEDTRDTPAAFVLINDEQTAFDAGLNAHTYSEISLGQGGTMSVDAFNTISLGGGLGPGARISRRCGLIWGAAGNWGVDFSFPFRYHSAPSSVTLTTVVADSLNGGTKSVVDIDYFGATLQIATSGGAGFTLNRWTASGGN